MTCPYHLNLASLIFSTMSTTSHLLISSFRNTSDQLFFISSYYVFISSQPCFSSAMSTTSHRFLIPSIHDISDQPFFISCCTPSISLKCFPSKTSYPKNNTDDYPNLRLNQNEVTSPLTECTLTVQFIHATQS